MNFWKEIFHEDNMKIDRVIATTMSIDLTEAAKTIALAKYYEENEDEGSVEISDKLMKLWLIDGFGSKFDFFYDGKKGIQNSLPDLLSNDTAYILEKNNLHAVKTENGVFHPKIILTRFTDNAGKVLWKVLISSHNLTMSRPYECAVVLRGKIGEKNHNFDELLDFLKDSVNIEIPLFAELNNIRHELNNIKFVLCDESDVEVKDITVTVNPNNFTKDISDKLNDVNWKVVSPSFETGKKYRNLHKKNNNLIYEPYDPADKMLSSHAKMYFKKSDNSDNYNEMWLGSANCSHHGLNGVNIECLVHLTTTKNNSFIIFDKNQNSFEFDRTTFKPVEKFAQLNYADHLLRQIISSYTLTMQNTHDKNGPDGSKGYTKNVKVTLTIKNGCKTPKIPENQVFILPVGYDESKKRKFNECLKKLKINGTTSSPYSFAVRLILIKGGKRTEWYWPADNIDWSDKDKKIYDADCSTFYPSLYNDIIAFKACYISGNKLRQTEFRDKWKILMYQEYKNNPEKQNKLDKALRDYLDVMNMLGSPVDPCEFICENTEPLTVYQQDAINQAYKCLTGNLTQRYLIADEAGLGKTFVAQGIIKKFAENRQDKHSPIRVIYFVSNLYLRDKTANKLLSGMKGWEHTKILRTGIRDFTIDRVSLIPPIRTQSNVDVKLYFVSGNIYGSSSSSEDGSQDERDYLKYFVNLKQNPKLNEKPIEEKRAAIVKKLVTTNSIDLVICDEFHRYADAAKEISNDFGKIPVLYMSATPYNWYNSQLSFVNDANKDFCVELDTQDNKGGLESIYDVLGMLKINNAENEYFRFKKGEIPRKEFESALRNYIWRNERVYGGDERRFCIPTKAEYMSPEYEDEDAVKNELLADKSGKSLMMRLFPGIYSFMCKGNKRNDDDDDNNKQKKSYNFYQGLDKDFNNITSDDFIFENNYALKTDMIDKSFKLSCIKNLQVENQLHTLWLTPVHSRYQPKKPFHKHSSKLLVFSGYVMVPRGISTIFSKYVELKNANGDIKAVSDAIEALRHFDRYSGEIIFNWITSKKISDKIKEIPFDLTLDEYINRIQSIVNDDWLALYIIGSPYLAFRKTCSGHEDAETLAKTLTGYFYKYICLDTTGSVIGNFISTTNFNGSDLTKLLYYFCAGCLDDMLNEYYSMSGASNIEEFAKKMRIVCGVNANSEKDLPGFKGVKVTALNETTYKEWKGGNEVSPYNCHYAVPFTPDKDDNGAQSTGDAGNRFQSAVQEAFNSPFWPMIMSTTSAGQEGIDLDAYCRRIMHYTVPYSPMAFEQRDGRIDRRRSLAAREKINLLWGSYINRYCPNDTSENSFWNMIFKFGCDGSGLSPMWSLREPVSEFGLERLIPFIPGTMEYNAYTELVDIKHEYRKSFGMPDEKGLRSPNMDGLKLNFINVDEK